MTRTDNDQLGRIVQRGERAKAKLPNFTDENSRKQLENEIAAGETAFNQLVAGNSALVTWGIRKMPSPTSGSRDYNDVKQDFTEALVAACRTWDPDRGMSLARWFSLLARRMVREQEASTGYVLKYSQWLHSTAYRAAAVFARRRANGEPDDENAVRKELNITSDTMWKGVMTQLSGVSVPMHLVEERDGPTRGADTAALFKASDEFEDETVERLHREQLALSLGTELKRAMFEELTERQREMLIAYHLEGLTFGEIGERYETSREHPRQQIAAAEQKMREALGDDALERWM